jgi:hypothetical protein
MTNSNTTSNNSISSRSPSGHNYYASLAPLLTSYSVLTTRLDDLNDIVQLRLQTPDNKLPHPVLEKMQSDLTTAKTRYVEAMGYWKDQRVGGRKGGEKVDESFERVVTVEIEECDALIESVQRQLKGSEKSSQGQSEP